MKKIEKDYHKSYTALSIRKKDLEEIIDIVVSSSNKIEYIVADSWKLDSAAELDQVPQKRISEFGIQASEPFISLQIRDFSNRLTVGREDELRCYGIFAKIDSLLMAKRRKLHFIGTTSWFYFTLAYFAIAIPAAVLRFEYHTGLWFWRYVLPPIGILYLALCVLFAVVANRRTQIRLTEDSPITGFVKRNKDRIILTTISLILGGVITLLVQWVLRTLLPPSR